MLVRPTRHNGEKIIRALSFLESSRELNAEWFAATPDGKVENIRVADNLLLDLLFSANGQTYESVQPYVREIEIEGTLVRVLNIEGLIRTKTDYREKDVQDKQVLLRIKQNLQQD